jgi:hypothetical protein
VLLQLVVELLGNLADKAAEIGSGCGEKAGAYCTKPVYTLVGLHFCWLSTSLATWQAENAEKKAQ